MKASTLADPATQTWRAQLQVAIQDPPITPFVITQRRTHLTPQNLSTLGNLLTTQSHPSLFYIPTENGHASAIMPGYKLVGINFSPQAMLAQLFDVYSKHASHAILSHAHVCIPGDEFNARQIVRRGADLRNSYAINYDLIRDHPDLVHVTFSGSIEDMLAVAEEQGYTFW